MENKLAIDFGNSNTVLALWNSESGSAETVSLPEYSEEGGFVIPSLTHYTSQGKILIGTQVEKFNLLSSPLTFRWMKRYISLRSPYSICVDGIRINAEKAAGDFLKLLQIMVSEKYPFDPEEITLSVPLEAFEHYENWLISLAAQNEAKRIRIIDEASAAAAGYGERVHPGEAFLLFDFGGSTMQAVVTVVQEFRESTDKAGRYCRILGKAGCGIGGAVLDRWIYEDFCRKNKLSPQNSAVIRSSRGILQACEQLKQHLSDRDLDILSGSLSDGRMFSTEYDRSSLEQLFQKNGLFESIHAQIQEAVLQAADHGYPKDSITKVIPVGGSCLIPAVQKVLTAEFGEKKMLHGEPMGAVARGAACFAGGLEIYDFIQHDYAVRYRDPTGGDYAFHPIIRRGTHYPTTEPVTSLKVKTVFENQILLGLAIYEISHQSLLPADQFEILFDENGEVRLFPLEKREFEGQHLYWMNEHTPAFLKANPPAKKGDTRFEVFFEIDENKMLLLTADDLVTGERLFSKFPAIRLS